MGVGVLLVGDEVRLKRDEGDAKVGPAEYNNAEGKITGFVENIKGGIFLANGVRGFRFWNVEDVEWTPRQALRKVLNCIDAVPQSAELPAMPGFDRDWVESVIKGQFEGWPPLSFDDAIQMALDWVDALPENVAETLPASALAEVEEARGLAKTWASRVEAESASGLEM